MKTLQLYDVTFQVGLEKYSVHNSSPREYWRSDVYSVKVMAQDLNDIVINWPNILLGNFPFESGNTSDGKYDAKFGNIFKFISLSLCPDKVLYNGT